MLRNLSLNVTLAVMSLTTAARCEEVGATPRQICTYTAANAYYADIAVAPGKLEIQWNKSTGAMTSFYWDDHWQGSEIWVEAPAPPSSVKQYENLPYYAVNIWIKTGATNPLYPDRITGYIGPKNVTVPGNNVTFAAIVEGTGTAWIVAQGTLTNNCSLE